MLMENAAQGHPTVEEEEAIMENWQSDDSGSYHSPEDELGHLLEKTRLKKVQLTMTPTIFLSSRRYGNP
jgi:protocatechuate 3,4-dioxygenase beta subunit